MWETTPINYFLRPSTNQFQFIKIRTWLNHVVWIISGGEHPEGQTEPRMEDSDELNEARTPESEHKNFEYW